MLAEPRCFDGDVGEESAERASHVVGAVCGTGTGYSLWTIRHVSSKNAVQGEQVEDLLIMLGLPRIECKVGNPPRSNMPLCGFILYGAIVLENLSFFPSNAFMASARSFNMFKSMLQLGLID